MFLIERMPFSYTGYYTQIWGLFYFDYLTGTESNNIVQAVNIRKTVVQCL
jgi:hypothetical protein